MSVKRYNMYLDGSVVDNDQPIIHTQQEDDGRYVLHTDYAALEARCAGLERERDALKGENDRLDKESDEYLKQRDESESDIGRIAAAIGQDLSSAYGVPHLIDDIEELDASHDRLIQERDALQAKLAEEEKACEQAISERDALEEILSNIAGQFGQEFSSSYGPESIQHDIVDLKDNRDIWQGKVEGLEKRVKESVAAKERAVEALRDAFTMFVITQPPELYPADHWSNRASAILAGHAPATPMLDQLAAAPQPITVQAAPSDRERRLETALHVIAMHKDMPGAKIARAALADTTNNDGG